MLTFFINLKENRRIDKTASDTEWNLSNIMQNIDFTLQLDESTFSNIEYVPLAYVCSIHQAKMYQETDI